MNGMFSQAFFGYHFDTAGYHTGKSLPLVDKTALLRYIGNWICRLPEIRITDIEDNLVMHIINQKVVFPVRDDGASVVWSMERNDFTLEVPTDQRTQVKRFYSCIQCKKPFTAENVKTAAGARETQITGMCELCWDKMFSDMNDGGDEDEPVSPVSPGNPQGV